MKERKKERKKEKPCKTCKYYCCIRQLKDSGEYHLDTTVGVCSHSKEDERQDLLGAGNQSLSRAI